MNSEIIKYPVRHPLLRNYIKFFWEIRMGQAQLDHLLIPQRNINLRFNLSETPQYVSVNNQEYLLEEVYFSGLQDHFTNARLKLNGSVHMLGVCFLPEGFYPFLQIPVSECKNQLLGAEETGLKHIHTINGQLKEAQDTETRLAILENKLASLLNADMQTPETFRKLFNALEQNVETLSLADFCAQHHIGIRQLERMYNKYVGMSAKTYFALNRFHHSLNELLRNNYSKLSDIAYGNGYFDQMHFIRDFKRFAGETPKTFTAQNNSILQIGKMK